MEGKQAKATLAHAVDDGLREVVVVQDTAPALESDLLVVKISERLR